ncbi:MAG: hypothetical protein AB7Q17_05075 [Phycisphaerae bacterium]
MAGENSAFHLRTADPAWARVVDTWLDEHELAGIPFADAYDLCVQLIRDPASVPEIVFIGTDWLCGDELAIVRYVHETWPATPILVYGDDVERLPVMSDNVGVLPSLSALRELLAADRAMLLAKLHAGVGRTGSVAPVAGGARPPGRAASPPRDELTPRELSALLGEADD